MENLIASSVALLRQLIHTPSYSGEEQQTAALIKDWFRNHNIPTKSMGNSVWAKNKHFDSTKPTLLLNSHQDTVKPNAAYTRDPFDPGTSASVIHGLGSNDAGGALVALMATFVHFYHKENLNYNLVVVASVEEETAGENSLRGILHKLPKIDAAIVGEPTQMQMAIAEKGLLVFDGYIHGTPGHAAHPNADNPLYKIPEVIDWIANFKFEKIGPALGPVKMTLTQIAAGTQHNVIPAKVHFVLDVRVNDGYTNKELVALLQAQAPCDLQPRSTHLNSSSISKNHPLVEAGIVLGRGTYGSPTLSDMAALDCPAIKLGPGKSQRSHQADEYILVEEIDEAIRLYTQLIQNLK